MILTVTLNPTWEVTHVCSGWHQGGVVRSERVLAIPGGKGVNVARGLRDLRVPAQSLAVVGGSVGAVVQAAIARERLSAIWVPIRGETRSNVTLFDPTRRFEIHATDPGPKLTGGEWRGLLGVYSREVVRHSVVVIAGSAPRGVPVTAYAQLLRRARRAGVMTCLDSSGKHLDRALRARPDLVKPNRIELGEWSGRGCPLETIESVVASAREMIRAGAGIVLVSGGADDAIVVSQSEICVAMPPHVDVRNTVGCGDAMMAGWCYAVRRRLSLRECLRWAVAAGTASVTVEEPGRIPRTVGEIARQVQVSTLDVP